jgi:hypothetical protein
LSKIKRGRAGDWSVGNGGVLSNADTLIHRITEQMYTKEDAATLGNGLASHAAGGKLELPCHISLTEQTDLLLPHGVLATVLGN